MKEKKYTFFRIVPKVIGMQFKASKVFTILNYVSSMIHALMWVGGTFATQKLFDTISHGKELGFMACLWPLLLLAGVTIGQQIMSGIWNFISNGVMYDKTLECSCSILHIKLQHIDPSYFEETSFLDNLNKTLEGTSAISRFSNTALMLFSFYTVYFGLMGTYFFHITPLLLLALLMSFVPALLGQILRVRVFESLEGQSAPLRREYQYYKKALCAREYFIETRVLGVFHYFFKLFDDTMLLFTKKEWKAERKVASLYLALNMITFIGMATSAYILFTAMMKGTVSIGTFAAIYSSLGQLFNQMKDMVTNKIGNVNRDIGKVLNYFRVLDMPERNGVSGTPDFSKGISAENIGFTYPGRDKPALTNVSMHIAQGETVAIVGENGSGKSTLVRLLTGIYRPSEGRVLVGGLDTKSTEPSAIFKEISGVFQKFQRYKMTLRENVIISDIEKEVDENKIAITLKEAHVELDDKCTYDTMLSPEFDGIDLSGGQWQRLAIARGIYRTNEFIILDEPTAAIDPVEETLVFQQFQHLVEGKCAIVVTHRLGSVKLANRVIVMDKGEIVDVGTHEELLSRPGKYSDMWKMQAQWYTRDKIAN